MMLDSGWPFVIACAVLLQGLGKFLDDYHLSSSSKDRARIFIIRAFVIIEQVRIPDVARRILIILTAADHPILSLRTPLQILASSVIVGAIGFAAGYVFVYLLGFEEAVNEGLVENFALVLVATFVLNVMLRLCYAPAAHSDNKMLRLLSIPLGLLIIGSPMALLFMFLFLINHHPADSLYDFLYI